MSSVGRAIEVIHDRDPKDVLLDRAQPLADQLEVYGDDALIAVYTRGNEDGEARTRGGLIITSKTNAEDLFQGKIGLLMKVGPEFAENNYDFFGGKPPEIGDWVMFRVGDTYSFKVRDQLFRTCEAKQIRGKVTKPDVIW